MIAVGVDKNNLIFLNLDNSQNAVMLTIADGQDIDNTIGIRWIS
jgi:hypothetical protein